MSEKPMPQPKPAGKNPGRKPPPRGARAPKNSDLDVQALLIKGEEVVLTGQIHWGIFWKPVVVLAFSFLLFLLVWQLGIVLGVAGGLYLAYAAVRRKMLMLVLTNKRILARYGILQVDVVDMRFKNLESVELERMLPGFIMGYANVIIMGTGNRYIYIPYVANGVAFRRAFNEMVLSQEDERIAEDAVSRAKSVGGDPEPDAV